MEWCWHITVTQFDNIEQRSLYKQWDRIDIINNSLYRKWFKIGEAETHSQMVFQYIVPEHQRKSILEKAHDIALSGHLGVEKTLERLRDKFYWPGWEKHTRDYIKSCMICQQIKLSKINNAAAMQPITTSRPLEIVTMDIAGPLPKTTSQNVYLLVICDHFTNGSKFIP